MIIKVWHENGRETKQKKNRQKKAKQEKQTLKGNLCLTHTGWWYNEINNVLDISLKAFYQLPNFLKAIHFHPLCLCLTEIRKWFSFVWHWKSCT